MRKSTSGFTIVELIVVIAVIAILASITIVAYNGYQAKATADAVEQGLKDIEKNLHAYAADQKWSTWPLDSAIDPNVASGPTIQQLITDLPAFKQYLPTAPTANGLPASAWTYDNDGDSKTSCGSNNNGTNILIASVPLDVATALDANMDDGNFNCGRIRYYTGSGTLSYALSYSNDLSL